MKNQENLLNIENRKKIYDLISKYPGLHIRFIVRKTNLTRGTVRYHLNYLQKRNLIKGNIENGYKRFFVTDNIGIQNKKMISLLRKRTSKLIVIFLLFKQTATKKELSEEFDIKAHIIKYYLEKLIDAGIIKKSKPNNGLVRINHGEVKFVEYNRPAKENVYVLLDYNLMNKFFIVNKNWFFDPLTKELLDHNIVTDYVVYTKKIKSHEIRMNDTLDRILNRFYEIFPPPYHI